ncbi:MAG: CapA family protein [Candidatus Cloacimonadaceae bacterium]|nr:CapA family protein [Candidatus Cloacimonadaceae bacterium]
MISDPPSVKLMFLGDISLNDDYNNLYVSGEKPFLAVGHMLREADLVVGNLECFSTGNQGENVLKEYNLKANPETLNYLCDLKLGLVGLANNHAYDNLDSGFQRTIEFLRDNKIAYIGAALDGREHIPYIFEAKGIKIAIFNYVAMDTNPRIPADAKVKLNWFNTDKVTKDIALLRASVDHIVIFPHWGGLMEGSMYPDRELLQTAKMLIVAGADLIVGHHSHTIQPYEIYRGKYIFYSLGNFCFSDIVKKNVRSQSDYGRTRHSVILDIVFSKIGYTVCPKPITNNNCYIVCDSPSGIFNIPNLSKFRILYDSRIVWGIYYFYEKNIYKIIRYFFSNQRNPLRQLFSIKPYLMKKTMTNLLRTIFKTGR